MRPSVSVPGSHAACAEGEGDDGGERRGADTTAGADSSIRGPYAYVSRASAGTRARAS
ncbi:hypothetical protein [Streptomyces phaeochromogenes]|uniref:hypothetical protein n=1 Tax=Streptomyces phaeochromogenes TaxID=1923 RepID=UPI0033D4B124|nr:hypothetical protein OG277_48990 [Streptomyces phaeochromogenes]WTA01736.1 hypothetical protein OHB08_05140 [Streptomyces phaeochromogenes]